MNGHPDRDKKLAAIAAAHDDWVEVHAGDAEFDPERAGQKPGSDYNQHYLDVDPPPGAEEDLHHRVRQAAQAVVLDPVTDEVSSGGAPPASGNTISGLVLSSRLSDGLSTISGQLDLASDVAVSPEAMIPPGLPVPDDPAAVSMFTAHRVDAILGELAHATERMRAAKAAAGDLREYHVTHIAGHTRRALDSAHQMTANLREHYPAEAAELDAVKDTIGLAKAVSPTAKAATTAHLLETTLHELAHADRHARAMGADDPAGDEWAFDADHCASHLAGAVEHAGKLRDHLAGNYPAEARWLNGIAQITHPARAVRHAGDDEAVDLAGLEEYLDGTLAPAVAARLGTIAGQVDLAAVHGRHVPGSAYTFRHGWIPLIGKQVNDKYPQWKIDQDRRDAAAAGAKTDEVPDAQARVLTPKQQAMAAYAKTHLAQLPYHDGDPPPARPGTVGEKLAQEDPALARLAAPGMSAEAIKSYIDARVSVEVARQSGQIEADKAGELKAALAQMHASQQKTIALIRRQYTKKTEDDDGDLRKHTVMNTLFTFAGVAVAGGAIATGMAPVLAALVAGLVPLANVIHDYARNLG